MIPNKLTQENLKAVMEYNAQTGEFFWKNHREYKRINTQVGTVVSGEKYRTSYRSVFVFGKRYYVHQLVWLYITGEFPLYEIDHRDRNGLNNRFDNLRLATRSQQLMNRETQSNSLSGVTGVTPFRKGWQVHICKDGHRHYLGKFDDFEKAVAVRKKAEKVLFGEFAL